MRMIKAVLLLVYCFCTTQIFTTEPLSQRTVIIGGGIIGAMESYNLYLNAKKNNLPIHIVVYDKSSSFEEGAFSNTAYHICPSLTPDEILSVVPRGAELVEKLAFLFNQPGGIRVDDVSDVNDSLAALQFKQAVEVYGKDPHHDDRTRKLLKLGKMSMDLWQKIYDEADEELKSIFDQSNFNACHEPQKTRVLHDGYRIDLIYDVEDAQNRAENMQKTYRELGYKSSQLLSVSEVIAIDPSLTDFCLRHSEIDQPGNRVWKKDAAALWRPGGCLSSYEFMPAFYAYLKKVMGSDFELIFHKEVVGVDLDDKQQIVGLQFQDGSFEHNDPRCQYVFCPGEAVGTLQKLGFAEPTYAGFAGPSLTVRIPLSEEQVDKYKNFNHCMEVHKVGIVLAWQARCTGNELLLQVGGTKAFYGDKAPQIHEAFATNRHLVQLNMLNDVLPDVMSIAFGWDTTDNRLFLGDLWELEEKGLLSRWVGRRAVAYDGFPTLGALYSNGKKVKNGRCTTHMGSGGFSFAPAAVYVSQNCETTDDAFTKKVLKYADSRR